ncbi:hypothetical protein IW261DRAFT_1610906 [Armillaria novae-zelandiae]|uniref:Uncharacterized protein n=1 Tax=Armillaria novae-zelandiae TaxID=153914 RepID=A0AA39NXV3_9AGAR|nr:hypothetical protein IW261DRAFT_1610906 [Armillaria novae-zelandiae]
MPFKAPSDSYSINGASPPTASNRSVFHLSLNFGTLMPGTYTFDITIDLNTSTSLPSEATSVAGGNNSLVTPKSAAVGTADAESQTQYIPMNTIIRSTIASDRLFEIVLKEMSMSGTHGREHKTPPTVFASEFLPLETMSPRKRASGSLLRLLKGAHETCSTMRNLTLGLEDVKRTRSIHMLGGVPNSGKSSSDVIAVAVSVVTAPAPSTDSVERLDEIRPYIRRG